LVFRQKLSPFKRQSDTGGFTETGVPMAFRLVAADMQEARLVQAGAAFQEVTSWHLRHPIA
jgi:amidase